MVEERESLSSRVVRNRGGGEEGCDEDVGEY